MTTNAPPPSSAAKAKLSSRAQVIARLRHPNLVRMLPLPGGAGLVPVANDARRLADFTLTSAPFKRFELEQVVRLMLDVLSGLSSLHEAVVDGERIVHGDVCPEHVYVGEHGTAKLVPLTSWHARPGVKHEPNGYTAPELLRGDPVDARADLFSVGVMLWEALAGRRLFPDRRAEAVLALLRSDRRPLLSVPTRLIWAAPLCAIVERAIALDPATRPQTAMELSNAIAKAVGKHLAKVNGDTWQDEAPTPVFQPRLHLPHVRSTTPPATVIDIDNEVTQRAATRAQLPQQSTPTPETPAAFAAASPPLPDIDDTEPSVRPPAGWLRASAFALLGAAAIVAVAWLGYTQRSSSATHAAQPAPVATLPAVVPPAAPLPAATTSAVAAPLVAAPEPSPALAPSPSASAASAAPSASARTKPKAPPALRARPKKAPSRPQAADYGI